MASVISRPGQAAGWTVVEWAANSGPVTGGMACGGPACLARRNVEALVRKFDEYVWRFEASGICTGPGIHFHERAARRRRDHAGARSLLADELFLEYVYAVLPSWGAHRGGADPARITEYSLLAASIRSAGPLLEKLWPFRLVTLAPHDLPEVSWLAWRLITSIRASASPAQIVAGSIVAHHLLPELIPPIDSRHTFRFFAGEGANLADEEQAFFEWFPYVVEIGHRCGGAIDAMLGRGGYLATSPAKIIDNAIVGFIQARETQPYA